MRVSITAVAHDWLQQQGSDLTLRTATQLGCCGGQAAVPIAEARTPDDPAQYRQYEQAGVRIYVAPALQQVPLRVDLEGFGPWRRLGVEAPVQPPLAQ